MRISGSSRCRRAAAATELALLLPTIVLLFVIAFDFCRAFHYYTVVTNCARAGAVYASDPYSQVTPAYASVSAAALADWPSSLGDPPTVSSTPVTNGGHNYADVQVSYSFQTVLSYTGVPTSVTLSRTIRVRVAQQVPNF